MNNVEQVQHPLPPLCVDVPEFFPKGPGNLWTTDKQQKPQQFYPHLPENPYHEDFFHYKAHIQTRKTVAVYQVNIFLCFSF